MVNLPADVLQVIVDPIDRQSLHYLKAESCFYNERSRSRYTIGETGIAVLLADEAESVSDDEHKRLLQLVAAGQSIATGSTS